MKPRRPEALSECSQEVLGELVLHSKASQVLRGLQCPPGPAGRGLYGSAYLTNTCKNLYLWFLVDLGIRVWNRFPGWKPHLNKGLIGNEV